MKDSSFAFAVSAVRVRETGLLSRTQTETLITAQDEDNALRLLEDYGYTGISSDSEAVLTDRLFSVTEFVREVSPDKDLLSFLFIKNDFHNLKAAMKCSVSGVSPDVYFLPPDVADTEKINTAVAERSFDSLPDILIKPAREAWETFVTGLNGQLCEVVLDRAALEASVAVAEMGGDDFCIGLARLRQKCTALLIAYRCAAAGKGADFIKSAIPDNTDMPKAALVKAALAGCEDVITLARACGMDIPESADASDIKAASYMLEDEYISRASFVSMGAAPVISYYLRAEREVSRIRVILSCKRCRLPDDVCRKRAGL